MRSRLTGLGLRVGGCGELLAGSDAEAAFNDSDELRLWADPCLAAPTRSRNYSACRRPIANKRWGPQNAGFPLNLQNAAHVLTFYPGRFTQVFCFSKRPLISPIMPVF